MKNWYRILILFLVSSSLLTFTAAAQQKNTDTERALVLKLAAYLKDSSYIKNTIRQIETEKKVETQITGYQKLHKQVQRMLLLQSELKWLNMEAIRLAYEDMKRIEGFDAVKYHVDVFQCFTSANQVGHCYVFHVDTATFISLSFSFFP